MLNLTASQVAIEEEALCIGAHRYDQRKDKDEAQTRPGHRLVVEAVKPLAGAISEWIAEVTSGKPSPNANVGYFLQDIDPMTAAFLTARKVVGALARRMSLQTVALDLASILEDVVNFDKLREESPRGYAQLQRKIAGSSHQGYRHVVMRRQQKYAGVRTIKWGNRDKLSLGLLLIDLMEANVFLNGFPLFSRELIGAKNHQSYTLLPTATTITWLEASHDRCKLLAPLHMPMVCEPVEWTNVDRGGYVTPKMQYSLIKTRGRKNYLEELKHHEMPMVYTSINALQSTAWRINGTIMDTLRTVWERALPYGKMPTREPLVVPPNAPDGSSDEEIQRVKAAKAQVHDQNIRLMSKRIAMGTKLWLADKFSSYEAIYFPHALDWRGRAYPVANYMHPQGDDTGKALLEFAEGKALGENGAYWLAVHGANCYGVDKLAFDDRAQWVLDNEEEIIDSALRPLDGNLFWTKTDEAPWRFLAFCKEWAGYVMSGRSESYVSRQPVAFDGSCNGLQHYSMMLRDEVGGKATNLIPAEKPSDIYSLVAAEATRLVTLDAPSRPEAKAWVGKIVRKVAKQPTMTMPYGAGQFGYKEQIVSALRKMKEETGADHLAGVDDFTAARYLASIMPAALAGVVVKAAEAMTWLQTAARIAAEDGLPIRWMSPSGLPVVQDYREVIGEQVALRITGDFIRLTLSREGDVIDRRKQAQGIAPNFVHALDAAHMMRTVVLCLEQGIHSLAMVHDSYATHAGDADTLNVLLREAFVQQYEVDVLAQFRDSLLEQLPPKLAKKIPPVPTKGSLELEAVRSSDYFFA